MWSGNQRLSFSQWLGILIMLAVVGIFAALWPRRQGVWWQRAINAYAVPAVPTGALGTFILMGNGRARRRSIKP